ncbi:hypothetical protein GTO27_03920, partial [Candidatus Bathyarchaeota archaeon]|nr:hypothetical protein [Candidatus Bathyarchaeota archaeon]
MFREALAGYAFSIAGIIAGTIVAFRIEIFSIAPWSVAAYPAVLSARGIIGGLFSGRLSTALHLGIVYPKVLGNTEAFRRLFGAVIALTCGVSIMMSAISTIVGIFVWGTTFVGFASILAVILATMTLGLLVALITVGVSFISFRHGLDPDVFLYPAVSAMSDIFITLSYISVLSLFFSGTLEGRLLVVSLSCVLPLLALLSLARNIGEREYVRTLEESMFTLLIVAAVVNVTGGVLNMISSTITGRNEIYIVFPALLATMGNVGAVVGSTATTKLAVGLLDTSFSGMKNHLKEILSAWTASLVMFVCFSFLSLSVEGGLSTRSFLDLTFLLFAANVISALAIILISYAIAVITFQKGLDPDNFVIPI